MTSCLDLVKSKNSREFLESWRSDKAAINRHIEINHGNIPFKRDKHKAKRAQHLLGSDQYPNIQRLTQRLLVDQQASIKQ